MSDKTEQFDIGYMTGYNSRDEAFEEFKKKNQKLIDRIEKFIDSIENRHPQSFLITILDYFIKDMKQILEELTCQKKSK